MKKYRLSKQQLLFKLKVKNDSLCNILFHSFLILIYGSQKKKTKQIY